MQHHTRAVVIATLMLSLASCGDDGAGNSSTADTMGGDAAPECGNGLLEPGEQCDDGNTDLGDGCNAICAYEVQPVCGNGSLEPGERCDDGNTDPGDGCDAACDNEVDPACGDGILQAGEACEDGNTDPGDGCDANCQTEPAGAVCGNGRIEVNEQCDDGNVWPGDGCSPTCQNETATPVCGNATLEVGEQCEDGNTAAGDGCSSTCQNEGTPACGDGILQSGEQCDDGPQNSDTQADACRASCMDPACGDGVVDTAAGEVCDDGDTSPGDGCGATCQIEATSRCGNGTVDLSDDEQCDDGNTTPGDGCDPTCRFEPLGQSCGDANIDNLEVCDDGNTANGDACNPTCNLANTTSLFIGQVGAQGLTDGVGSAARLGGEGVMAVDNDHLWLADGANHMVRRVDIASARITTVAGNGTAGYADDPTNGVNARFQGPGSITSDGTTVWVGDEGNARIRAISATAPHGVTTVAGDGSNQHRDGNGTSAGVPGSRGLTYYGGMVYFLDPGNATLRRFDPATGEVVTLAGQAGQTGRVDGVGTAARFISPRYMASDAAGMLYIADTNGNMIRSYNIATGYVGTFAGSGAVGYVDGVGTAAQIHRPRGITSDGTSLYFAEFNQHTIRQGVLATQSMSTALGQHCNGATPCTGGYQEGVGTQSQFNNPFSVAYHYPTKSLFVLDSGNRVLRRVQ